MTIQIYDERGKAHLVSANVKVDFAGKASREEPYNAIELQQAVIEVGSAASR